MPVAFRASAQVFNVANTGSIVVPASVQTGDLLILQTGGGYGATIPAGWTQDFFDNSSSDLRGFVAYKTATGTDAGSTINLTYQGSFGFTINLIAISGSTTFRTPTSHLRSSGGGSAIINPTPLAAGDLVVYLGFNRQSSGAPVLGRGTTDKSGASASNLSAGVIGYELLAADAIVGQSFTSPSEGSGYLYSMMTISGGGTPSTSYGVVSSEYVEVASFGMGGVAVSSNYVEVGYSPNPTMQVESIYTEALAGGAPQMQLESTYLEVLAPSYPAQRYNGWGIVK